MDGVEETVTHDDEAGEGMDGPTSERVEALTATVASLEAELADARATIEALERRARLERELTKAGAVDLEAAVAVAEAAMKGREEVDAAAIAAELRGTKPFLFGATTPGMEAASARSASGAMAPAVRTARNDGRRALREAATAAARSGRREDVLKYLRLRRGR